MTNPATSSAFIGLHYRGGGEQRGAVPRGTGGVVAACVACEPATTIGSSCLRQGRDHTGRSFNGRTRRSGRRYRGSNPCLPAISPYRTTYLRQRVAIPNPCLSGIHSLLGLQLPLAAFDRLQDFATSLIRPAPRTMYSGLLNRCVPHRVRLPSLGRDRGRHRGLLGVRKMQRNCVNELETAGRSLSNKGDAAVVAVVSEPASNRRVRLCEHHIG